MPNFNDLDDEYSVDEKYGPSLDFIEKEMAPTPTQTIEEFEEEEEDLSDMSEVEIRLEEANCLKALLYNSLFEEPLSPIAKRVEKRVRGFIHNELKNLLGLEVQPIKPIPSDFDPDEVDFLKALVKRAKEKKFPMTPEVKPVAIPTPEPVVKRTAAPEPKNRVKRVKVKETRPPPEQQPLFQEVTTPGGMVLKTEVNQQVKPPSHMPRLPVVGADQLAAYFENQQAQTSAGVGKILEVINKNGE